MQSSLWQWLVWNRNSRQGCWSDTPGMMCRADNHSKVRWTGNRAGKVAEEGALPEPHSAGHLSAGSACRITITLNPITSGGQLVLHLVQLLATATPAVPVSPSGAGVLPHAEQAVLGGMQHLALLPQWLGVHDGRLEDPLPVHPTVHAAPVAVPNLIFCLVERQQLQALRLPSAFSAALGKSLQSAPDWMWSQAWESGRRCPPSPAKGSSTHLLAAFLLTWVARRPLPKQRRVVRRRARAPAGRNLVTRRRRRTRTRPQLHGTLVPTCSEWSRAAYSMPTHLQQQLGLVQSGLSSLTINSK